MGLRPKSPQPGWIDDETEARFGTGREAGQNSVVLPAALHRDLVAYAEIMSRKSGKPIEPSKLIAPMLERFVASDREFAKARGAQGESNPKPATTEFPPLRRLRARKTEEASQRRIVVAGKPNGAVGDRMVFVHERTKGDAWIGDCSGISLNRLRPEPSATNCITSS